MVKVITYGTYDHLHQGHINLLKRAKALGDYLIVGVTTENFDINRGKINVDQSLMERIEAVKSLGIADEVFPEEYMGQKIDDIKRYGVDIFTVGSDWEGHFDYLNEYCKVVYLPRTEGISSTQIRKSIEYKLGAIGTDITINKFKENAKYVNGLVFNSTYFDETPFFDFSNIDKVVSSYEELLKENDIIYVATRPEKRYDIIKKALCNGKHVISESPIALSKDECEELFSLARKNNLVLFDSIKTAFLLSFSRLILLIKGGIIGDVKAIDATCTSLEFKEWMKQTSFCNSITEWISIGLLPVFKILGLKYHNIYSKSYDVDGIKGGYSKINIEYDNACATLSLGIGVKSESDMRISGTKGYIYIPSPWWKSEYFETRFENKNQNKPYYYQSDGEGIRMELVHLVNCIKKNIKNYYVEEEITLAVTSTIQEILK